jgi:DNA-binding Xre family transcriptional regulator
MSIYHNRVNNFFNDIDQLHKIIALQYFNPDILLFYKFRRKLISHFKKEQKMKDKTLKILLIDLDITQRALSKATGIQESKLSLYANGLLPSEAHREKIAKALEISISDLWTIEAE